MKRHAALLAFFVSTVVLLTGCFTSSQMAKLQMPANYAKSPTLEAKSSWRTAVLPPTGGRVSDPSAPGGLYDYAGMALMKKGSWASESVPAIWIAPVALPVSKSPACRSSPSWGLTQVPRTPEFVKGVVNLRGKVIPVTDLRLKFGLPEID